MNLRTVRRGYPIVAVALILAYYASPEPRPWVVAAIGLLSVGAIATGVARFRPQRRGAWILIAAAVMLLTIGDVLYTAEALSAPGPPRYPGLPDLFYLSAYPALALGVLWLGQPRLPSRDWPMILDTSALSLAGSLLVWILIVRQVIASEHLVGLGLATAVASWIGYMAVLAASARVLLIWPTNASLGLVASGVFAYLVADFFYGRDVAAGSWTMGSLVDLGYLAFSLLCGAGALTGSMGRISSATYTRHQIRPLRLLLVAVALLVAPTLVLVEASSGQIATAVAIAAVSAAVGLLVVGRLSLTAQAYQRRGIRERVVRHTSQALVLAATESDVVRTMRTALCAMLGKGSVGDVRLVDSAGAIADPAEPSPAGTAGGRRPLVMGEFVLPVAYEISSSRPAVALPRRDRVLVFTAPLAELIELETIVRTLANQAGSALDRIRLTDHLRAEERERYFRTLVLTSEDVTLISRDGRVKYATPSAWSMFGRDVSGELLDDLILAEPPELTEAGPDRGEDVPDGGVDRFVNRPDRIVETRVRSRDLTDDPSVAGVVTTLRDTTAERRLQRDLAFRANHDPLTGLANAQLFREELSAAGRQRDAAPGRAALFIDLDDFKAVNDTYGHHAGDQFLTETARRIRSCVRAEDLAARLGGDEFAVILLQVADADTAETIAQCLVEALARPVPLGPVELVCTASVGLAHSAGSGSMEELLHHADVALYRAKATGKGGWTRYHDDMASPPSTSRTYRA